MAGSSLSTTKTRLTFLIENRTVRADLATEHGLSVLVEHGGHSVLLDAGASRMLVRNAGVLEADLSRLCAIALSHGHYDHTGGLDAVLGKAPPDMPVYAHPSALAERYAVVPGEAPREIGFRGGDLARSRMRLSCDPVEIAPGVLLTGQIPRTSGFEDTGGPFYLDTEGKEPDPILDDQALFVTTGAGNILVAGCAHSGIVNTVMHAAAITGDDRFLAVVGGMHLAGAGQERLIRTTLALTEMKISRIGPAHCTGESACSVLAAQFGDRFLHCAAGTVLEF